MFAEILSIIVILVYSVALLFIFSYSISQLNLVFLYLHSKRTKQPDSEKLLMVLNAEEPMVTVQLPVYNELYVAERLIDCIVKLEYPKDKLEIQLLDDSTDETQHIIAQKVKQYQQEGFLIHHIQRNNRYGFKAGALSNGLQFAAGEFIAIFDSDFLPPVDFLKKTIRVFSNDKVGVVQTRWDHLNKNYSMLTRLQAFGLDAHFSIEQKGRSAGHHFINFNGTAGVWRKKCIQDAGGWESDTLTEDLDLSYRAQLKGWKFIYLEEVDSPAELPVTMSALKNQQYRWNKGAAECVKKNLKSVLVNKDLSLRTRLHALFHLMNSTVFVAIMITALLSIPMLLIKDQFPDFHLIFFFATFFLLGFLALGIFYFISLLQQESKFYPALFRFVKTFPLFLSVTMGLSLHNAVAVIEGYAGKKTSFIRTPKFNLLAGSQKWKSNKYHEKKINWITIAEGLLALYFTSGILLGISIGDCGLLPFHMMLTFGFGFVFYLSVSQSLTSRQGKFIAAKNDYSDAALVSS
jgi:cellulose synthase/poly-beta-1,6-N-acetylglucosamine synthase-like glycosyltransferase